MKKCEGVIQGFTSNGKAAIIDGVSYGAYDPAFWKGAQDGDHVSFMWQKSKDGKWNNVQAGTVTVFKQDTGEYTKEDILEARKVAVVAAANYSTDLTIVDNANTLVDYLLGKDQGRKEKEVQKKIDSNFDFDV